MRNNSNSYFILGEFKVGFTKYEKEIILQLYLCEIYLILINKICQK